MRGTRFRLQEDFFFPFPISKTVISRHCWFLRKKKRKKNRVRTNTYYHHLREKNHRRNMESKELY